MDLSLAVPAALAVAALVLVVGRRMIERIAYLQAYAIPEPVVGGLVAAFLLALLHLAGVRITFDMSLQPGLMLAFFATIGLGADARMLARGGGPLLVFTLCVVGMLVMENIIGVGTAKVLGVDPVIGLIAGSVTMAGGHGTGPAWGQRFTASVWPKRRSSGLRPRRSDSSWAASLGDPSRCASSGAYRRGARH